MKGVRRPSIYSAGTIGYKELAQMAGVSISTLYVWRKRGLLDSIERGVECGVARIDKKAAKEWIKINARDV